jgi:predicted nucleic acid-binding protein
MRRVILDTPMASHLYGNCPEAKAVQHILKDAVATVTFATVADMHSAALTTEGGDNRISRLESHLHRQYPMVDANDKTARVWGRLHARASLEGHPLAKPEHTNALWVAASAVYHRVALLTEKPELFLGLPGLEVVTLDT